MTPKARMLQTSNCRARAAGKAVCATIAIGLALWFCAAPAEARQETAPSQAVVVVIDVTALTDTTTAEQDIASLITDLLVDVADHVDTSAQVGLLSFGGSADVADPACENAVETMLAISEFNPDDWAAAAATIAQSGSGSLASALRSASEQLLGIKHPRIVLITGALNGCEATEPNDLCSLAVDSQIRIDSIGLLVDEPQAAGLQCLADATNGSFAAVNPADRASVVERVRNHLVAATRPAAGPAPNAIEVRGAAALQQATPLTIDDVTPGEVLVFRDSLLINGQSWYELAIPAGTAVSVSSTVFNLPELRELTWSQELCVNETCSVSELSPLGDTTLASLRCWACGDALDERVVLKWGVTLPSTTAALSGEFPIELRIDPVLTGAPCSEPDVCWFRQEISTRTAALIAVQQDLASISAQQAPNSLVTQLNEIRVDLSTARSEFEADRAVADQAQATARGLQLQATEPAENYSGPLVLGGTVGISSWAAALIARRRRGDSTLVAERIEPRAQPRPPEPTVLLAVAPTIQPAEPTRPSWLEDPGADHLQRWWDGEEWTRFTRPRQRANP